MNIFGFEIKRPAPQAMAIPPQEYKSGKFTWVSEPTQVIPATVQNYVAALQGARAKVIQERSWLYDMYQNALDFDSNLNTVIMKRLIATSGKRVEYVINDQPVPQAKAVIDSPRFTDFVNDLIMAKVFWGMGLFEFGKRKWNGQELFDYTQIPIKHVDPYQEVVRKYQYAASNDDKSYKEVKSAFFVGEKDDLGLLLQATLLALYKRDSINRWSNYIRLAGNNFERVKFKGGEPDANVTQKVLNTISNRSGEAVKLPANVDVEFDNNSSTAQNELFEGAVAYFDDQMTKLVLGQTMTTDDGSSRSQSETHERVQETLFEGDSKMVIDVLNYDFTEVLPMYGIPGGGTWRFIENTSIKRMQQAELDLKLKELGFIWTTEQLKERYGL